jgi:two-component system response regulator LytT
MKLQYQDNELWIAESAHDHSRTAEPVFAVKPMPPEAKKSFLVFKHNKYLTVPTRQIAFFYVKFDSPLLVCNDRQEYAVNYSLKQIHNLVTNQQFFRLNKQYLINFDAVKEVEHYFARKLLVKLTVEAPDKLLVSKEKASDFLRWLENR